MTLVTEDPAKHGLDAGRLARIDAHFDRWVDDGRLPGWQVLVARHGEVVHSATGGWSIFPASWWRR